MSKDNSPRKRKRTPHLTANSVSNGQHPAPVKTAEVQSETPEVSSQSLDKHLEQQAARWLSDIGLSPIEKLKQAGLQTQQWGETILATTPASDQPALLIYLPPDETLAVNLSATLAAVSAWQQAGDMPGTYKILLGPVEATWLAAHKDELAAEAIIYTLGEYNNGRPLISLGLKGLLEVELKVQTMSQDAPSAFSEVLPGAAWTMVRALDALKSDTQEIKIDYFENDLVALPSDESRSLLKSVPDHADRLVKRLEQYGLKHYIFELGDSLVLQTEYRVPTVNISALECGDFETGRLKLPSTARAIVDFHLLPDQHPDRIFEALQNYMVDKNFDSLEVRQLPGSLRPTRTPLSHPFIQKVIETFESLNGQLPLVAPISPFSGFLAPIKEVLGWETPAVCTGLAGLTADQATLYNQARFLANLLPSLAGLQPLAQPDLIFELPPETELALSEVAVSMPSAPVSIDDDLAGLP